MSDAIELGSILFDALLQGEVRDLFFLALGRSQAEKEPLSVRLCFSAAVPELAALSWEYLYWPARGRFLELSNDVSISRSLDLPEGPRPLLAPLPLRILCISASPLDNPLRIEEHHRQIDDAFLELRRYGHVEFQTLEEADTEPLARLLERSAFDVLHIVAHGTFDPRRAEGTLILQDILGRQRPVSDRSLAALLGRCSPRLAVLCSCHSGEAADHERFAGIAQQLIVNDVANVIAMRSPVRECDALDFTSVLYGSLARGDTLARAITNARVRVQAEHSTAWGIPAVFSRTHDDRLFDLPRHFGHPLGRQLLALEAALATDSRQALSHACSMPLESAKLGHQGAKLMALRRQLKDHRSRRELLECVELVDTLRQFVSLLTSVAKRG